MISDKIKELRQKESLSQEQFAEQINVSRQAVTRWETGRGTPDIDNLIAISNAFHISIDELLKGDVISSTDKKTTDDIYSEYISKKCDIHLTDWNDNLYNAYILSEDDKFVFYYINGKEKIAGVVGKRFITKIALAKLSKKEITPEFPEVSQDFFENKTINIYLNEKYFWSGLVGAETAYADISSFTLTEHALSFQLQNGSLQEIPFCDIVRLETYL